METTSEYVLRFLNAFYPHLTAEQIEKAHESARAYEGLDAVRHLFHVASSLDSLVVGEREIITQVRNAYDRAHQAGMTGDFTRIAVTKAIECAKQVYTETKIAAKPISVVNLGFRKLLERDLNSEQSIAFIGAGQTIEAIAGNLKEFNFKSTKVFNRTLEKAATLAKNLNGSGHALSDLEREIGAFDVLITCTGSEEPIIDSARFAKMVNGSQKPKIILDLAIPHDIDAQVMHDFDVDYISIDSLKEEARENLKAREKEIFQCETLVEKRLEEFEEAFKTRKLELAMAEVPRLMKEIKSNALSHTFSNRISALDPQSKELLIEILDHLEKKYISLPMKMAKQVILDKELKDPVIG